MNFAEEVFETSPAENITFLIVAGVVACVVTFCVVWMFRARYAADARIAEAKAQRVEAEARIVEAQAKKQSDSP